MMKRSGTWISMFILGILFIILGLTTLIRPQNALMSIIIIYGIFAMITGIADIVFYCKIERYTGLGPIISLVTGILSVMTGVLLLICPGAGEWILSLLFPIWFIAHCISRLTHLGMMKFMTGKIYFYFSVIMNILGIIHGIVLIFIPAAALISLSFIIGCYLILLGADLIGMSIQQKKYM